jgi:uncharacterized cupin superfamily protein
MMNFSIKTFQYITVIMLSLLAISNIYADTSRSPVKLDSQKISGIGLESVPPIIPDDMVLSGNLDNKVASLFDGEELSVSIFESTPAITDHREKAFPLDEFVYILSGMLILTELDGTRHEFTAGNFLVVPLGFKGTWEMQGNYRELVVVKKKEMQW